MELSAWGGDPMAWDAGGGVLRCGTAGSDLAPHVAVPVATDVTFEGEVRFGAARDESWKVAGLAIARDPENFWALLLVEDPDAKGKRHHIELGEMRGGHWPAQYDRKRTINEVAGDDWKAGEAYRLRIVIGGAGVEGTVRDASGRTIFRRAYAPGGGLAMAGRPALRVVGCEAAFAGLEATWTGASPPEPRRGFPAYACESAAPDIRGKATGFFHLEEIGDRPWVIDPLGRGFVPLGIDHARYRGPHCEALGYAPYGKKNDARYASVKAWEDETIGRLKSWGFNLLAGGTEAGLLRRGLAHAVMLSAGTQMAALGDEFDITPNERRPCSAFPNVFHPKFEAYCRHRARVQCEPHRGDPWLFGYFLDNELAWWGRGDVDAGLFDAVMRKGPGHSAKRALRDFLAGRHGGDVATLNRAWGLRLESLDEILAMEELPARDSDAAAADKKAFAALCADRYFSIFTRAVRDADPDHMILGCRFAGGRASDVVWASAGKHCEMLTFNYYGTVDLDREIALDHRNQATSVPLPEAFAEFHRMGGRPMMVTEWSFPALDSGLPCTKGAGQRFRTQGERAKASEIFARTILGIPFMVGYDYFMWVDEPALGISSAFPENTNYGLVNEDGQPYPLLTEALGRVHRDAIAIRKDPRPPPARPAPPARVARWESLVSGVGQGDACRQDGDRFLARSGPVTIEAKVGEPGLARILLGDRPIGMLGLGIHRREGKRAAWPRLTRLVGARVGAGNGGEPAGLVLTGESSQPGGPYEATCRIVPLPGREAFVIACVSLRNSGAAPLDLGSLFFRIDAVEGAGEQPLEADRPPRLWKALAKDGWLASGGAFAGFVAPPGDASVRFWIGEAGSKHPDARWPMERTLAPDETVAPDPTPWMVAIAGDGGKEEWSRRSEALGEAMRGGDRD